MPLTAVVRSCAHTQHALRAHWAGGALPLRITRALKPGLMLLLLLCLNGLEAAAQCNGFPYGIRQRTEYRCLSGVRQSFWLQGADSAQSVRWSFAQGGDVVGDTVSLFFTPADTQYYTITVTQADGSTCTSPQLRVQPLQPTQLDFRLARPEDTLLCNPGAGVTLISNTQHVVKWDWTLGGQYILGDSTGQASFLMDSAGVFDLTLTALDSFGCQSRISRPDLVQVTDSVLVDFSFPPRPVCENLPVQFTPHIQFGGSQPAAYNWAFNNGQPNASVQDTPPPVTFPFFSPFGFTVSLEVTTTSGCVYRRVKPGLIVTVPGSQFPAIQVVQDSANCYRNKEVLLRRTSPNPNQFPIDWHASDGATAVDFDDDSTYITAQRPGDYQVWATMNPNGCNYPSDTYTVHLGGDTLPDNFTPGDLVACNAQDTIFLSYPSNLFIPQVRYPRWEVVNSLNGVKHFQSPFVTPTDTVFRFRPGQTGVWDLRLIMQDSFGCSDTLEYPNGLAVGRPSSSFTLQDSSLCLGDTARFRGQDSLTPDRQFVWSLYDTLDTLVHRSTGINLDWAPTEPGAYTVGYGVRRNGGCLDSSFVPQLLQVVGPTAAPQATPYQGCAPDSITLRYSPGDFYPANLSVNYSWISQSGKQFTPQTPGDTLTRALLNDTGDFALALQMVAPQLGCTLLAEPPGVHQVGIGDAKIERLSPVCSGAEIRLAANAGFGAPTQVRWRSLNTNLRIADTTLSPTTLATDTFGHFVLEAWLTDTQSTPTCSVLVRDTLRVLPPGPGFATINSNFNCAPAEVEFRALDTLRGVFYQWAFGDGATFQDSLPQATHRYTSKDTQTVRLITTRVDGCRDTVQRPAVQPLTPSLNWQFIPQYRCDTTALTMGLFVQGADTLAVDWGQGAGYTYLSPDTQLLQQLYTVDSLSPWNQPLQNSVVRIFLGSGCTWEEFTDTLRVYRKPELSFTANLPDPVCTPVTVTFDASASRYYSDLGWDLDNDGVWEDSSTVYQTVLQDNGRQRLVLRASNGPGCSANTQQQQIFYPGFDTVVVEQRADTLVGLTAASSYQWFRDFQPLLGATDSVLVLNQPGTYFLRVSRSFCQDSSALFPYQVTSRPELAQWSLYPNPAVAGRGVNIARPSDMALHYRLLDRQGKQVGQGRLAAGEPLIELPELSPGVYLLECRETNALGAEPFHFRLVVY